MNRHSNALELQRAFDWG